MFCDKPVPRGSSKLGVSVITKGIKIYFKIAFSSRVGWGKSEDGKRVSGSLAESLLLCDFFSGTLLQQ